MPKKDTWLTGREIEVAEAIMKYDSVTEASKELGLKPSTLYSVIYRIRQKLTRSRFDVNRINSWRKKSRTMARLLVPYMKIVITSELPEGED